MSSAWPLVEEVLEVMGERKEGFLPDEGDREEDGEVAEDVQRERLALRRLFVALHLLIRRDDWRAVGRGEWSARLPRTICDVDDRGGSLAEPLLAELGRSESGNAGGDLTARESKNL